jgi:hypothetical protein
MWCRTNSSISFKDTLVSIALVPFNNKQGKCPAKLKSWYWLSILLLQIPAVNYVQKKDTKSFARSWTCDRLGFRWSALTKWAITSKLPEE